MQVHTEITSCGFSLELTGAWPAEACAFRYPEPVWSNYPDQEKLVAELAYLTTLVTPVILRHHMVCYDTPEPAHFNLYNSCFEQAIPNLVEHVPAEGSEELLARFRNASRIFPDENGPEPAVPVNGWEPGRVILPLSFGKDSLLSLSILTTLGYDVFPVIVDERVLPRVASLRGRLQQQMAEEIGIVCSEAVNEIQLLSDYQVLGQPETWVQQGPVHFVLMLAMLPFCHFHRAPTIICNNEYGNSLLKQHREGYLTPSMVMQSHSVTAEIKQMIKQQSGGQIELANLIGGLGDFSIHTLLHQQFPEFGRYRASCHIEVCNHERWCHNCTRCARAYLFHLAIGQDPADLDFEECMLREEKAQYYSLFRNIQPPPDPFHQFRAEEETLACQMAIAKGASAPLLQRFTASGFNRKASRKSFRKIFRLQQNRGDNLIERQAAEFLKQELAALSEPGLFEKKLPPW